MAEKKYRELPPQEKLSASSWQITINSNTEEHHGKFKKFERIIKKLILSPMLLNFFDVREDSESDWVNNPGSEIINRISDKLDLSASFEVGEIMKRLHVHIIVVYFHTEHVKLDTNKLNNWFTEQGVPSRIEAKLRAFSGTGARRYANKNFGKRVRFRVTSELRNLDGEEEFYDSAQKK
jgi:hypothetical protein